MRDRIKIWWSRLWCLHQWEESICSKNVLNNLAVYGQGIYKAWICKKCGREVMSFVEPISFYKL